MEIEDYGLRIYSKHLDKNVSWSEPLSFSTFNDLVGVKGAYIDVRNGAWFENIRFKITSHYTSYDSVRYTFYKLNAKDQQVCLGFSYLSKDSSFEDIREWLIEQIQKVFDEYVESLSRRVRFAKRTLKEGM